MNFIISPEMMKIGDPYHLLRIHAELIQKDWFMTLLDVKEYIQTNNATAYDVATHFHLPLSRIKEWIDDGMIEYKDIPGHKL